MKIRKLAVCAAVLAASVAMTAATAHAAGKPAAAAEKQKAAEQVKEMEKKFGALVRQGKELKDLRAKLAKAPQNQKKALEKAVREAAERWSRLNDQALTQCEAERDKLTAEIEALKAKNANTAALAKKREAVENDIKTLKSLMELINKA